MAQAATAENINQEDAGPDFSGFLEDLSSYGDAATAAAEKSGEVSAETSRICKLRDYHRGAFKALAKLNNMSDDKRQDYLRTFLPGLQILLDEIGVKDTPDLFEKPVSGADVVAMNPPQ